MSAAQTVWDLVVRYEDGEPIASSELQALSPEDIDCQEAHRSMAGESYERKSKVEAEGGYADTRDNGDTVWLPGPPSRR